MNFRIRNIEKLFPLGGAFFVGCPVPFVLIVARRFNISYRVMAFFEM